MLLDVGSGIPFAGCARTAAEARTFPLSRQIEEYVYVAFFVAGGVNGGFGDEGRMGERCAV